MKSEPRPASSHVRPTKCSCPAVVSSVIWCSRGLRGLRAGLRPCCQREARLLLAVEHRRGVIADGEAGEVVLFPIEQRLARHGQRRGGILRLRVGEQRAVELHRQLAGVVVADGIAHRHDRGHAALQQRVGGAGVAGLLLENPGALVSYSGSFVPGSLPWATARKSFQSATRRMSPE